MPPAGVRGAHLEGAVIVAEPNSGDVVAVVGGRDVGTDGFNRALDARRPIGSLVKPAVYLTALETGRYNAATLIEDAPIELKLADGSVWAPQNFEHQVYGRVPMARALAESMNLATVRLGLDLGLPQGGRYAAAAGTRTAPTLNPSLLLGTVEMTPLEVVQVYTSLANGGFRARLRAVRAVLDEHGRPLKSFKVQVEEAAPPAAVYQLDRMLTLVTTRGTGRDAAARLPRGHGRRRQDRHFLRYPRQLVRGIHRQLCRGRLGGLRRQSRHRTHRRRGRAAGLGRHPREDSSPPPSNRWRRNSSRIAGSDSAMDWRRPRPAARTR